jgi:hypothetical protein
LRFLLRFLTGLSIGIKFKKVVLFRFNPRDYRGKFKFLFFKYSLSLLVPILKLKNTTFLPLVPALGPQEIEENISKKVFLGPNTTFIGKKFSKIFKNLLTATCKK